MAVKKTKSWYKIVAPDYMDGAEIGTTLASEPSALVGKRVTISAIELTNNFSKYYLKMTFKVSKVDGTMASTDFDGSEVLRDYISRMILRRVRRIDTIQDFITKDGKKIRVKGLAVIGRRIKSSIQKKVRSRIRDILKSSVEGETLESFLEKLITDEIKDKIMRDLRNIYPIRFFEIRKTQIMG